ncbi:MAG TPA: gluconate 2-dehydrogenase subunit 3 family protein, partial [Micropepsaceae bacterium]|nr:gluconate 2-dehydrogenase subunit 3 family protein [Micropepsaceae bacterium]
APMPWDGEAWKRALDALDVEAQAAYATAFHNLGDAEADTLLHRMQAGELHDMAWGNVPPKLFFAKRVLMDICEAYYGHPTAWSEIGFGGPASPRGYVRMAANRRDPWEAKEVTSGEFQETARVNRNVR